MTAAAPAIAEAVKAIIFLIIFVVIIGIFLYFYFYSKIVCYFTPKEPFGTNVSTACSSTSGAFGNWNDKSSKNGTMCCRTPNVKNDTGDNNNERCCPTKDWGNGDNRGYCKNIPILGECTYDWQCQTNICRRRPEGDEGTKSCRNTDYNKPCSLHPQCESDWCHAGHCQ